MVQTTLTNLSRLLSPYLDVDGEQSVTDLSDQRQFRFSIESDSDLQLMIHNNSNLADVTTIPDFFQATATDATFDELTSDHILSKLYNYMKISEMSKYGISVFEMTFSSYLSYLTEDDLIKLATSYWCNGAHFKAMISHRGDTIRSSSDNCINESTSTLQLTITNNLLDTAMNCGATEDKIEAMLLQKRIDDGVEITKHTKYERNFYRRHLKHKFWNHECLSSVYRKNGWLTRELADATMTSFVKKVYNRVLFSKLGFLKPHIHESKAEKVRLSENFLSSFFLSHFNLDEIPKLYQEKGENDFNSYQIRKEILTRWCNLVELLASRGANIEESTFSELAPLQYAFQVGNNTYKVISSSYDTKNREFIPGSYHEENICVANVIWDETLSFL